MEIKINGHEADIKPDSEKTIGDVITGLDQWLAGSGHRISGLSIDGQAADALRLDDFFSREISAVKVLEIYTSSLAELTVESLSNLLTDTQEYENLNFEDKGKFLENWKEKAQALFIKEQMPELYDIFVNSFTGQINPRVVFSMVEERLREVKEPLQEFSNLRPLLEETCTRLTDLALDIQTGKEGRAAQTIQIFSNIAEKILRILRQFDIQGYLSRNTDDDKSFNRIIGEFGNLVRDLLEAYEKRDTVLVGDLAEYEASPKLNELYTAITKNILQPAEQVKI